MTSLAQEQRDETRGDLATAGRGGIRGRIADRHVGGRFQAVWWAFGLLLALCAIVAPSTVSGGELENLLYFGGILGIAALGQHVVIVSGGLDLSVAPVITLSALVFAQLANGTTVGNGEITLAALAAVGACLAAGIVSGLAVTVLRITPLIATLAVGALATGAAYRLRGTSAPDAVPPSLSSFVIDRPLGGVLSVHTVFWLVAVVAVAGALRATVVGRRLVGCGDNPRAMRAVGVHVDRYKLSAYVAASLFYGLAGIIVAGIAQQPTVGVGDPYLLPTIAAVVVGATPLGGGVGSVVATAVGALFMTQLDALTLSVTSSTAVQLIVQGAVIAAAVAVYNVRPDRWRVRRLLSAARTAAEVPPRPALAGEQEERP